ncbi:hypothetical protein N9L68_08060, partial [bacterium]|nr:hypothetical protein [bacterium]
GNDNADFEYRGYMLVTSLNAKPPGIMGEMSARDGSAPGLLTRMRQGVLHEVMMYRDQDGHAPVHLESYVTAWYNPETPRHWRYNEMRTTIEDNAPCGLMGALC